MRRARRQQRSGPASRQVRSRRTHPFPPSGCGSSASGSGVAGSLLSWPSLRVVPPVETAAARVDRTCSSSMICRAVRAGQLGSSPTGQGGHASMPSVLLAGILEGKAEKMDVERSEWPNGPRPNDSEGVGPRGGQLRRVGTTQNNHPCPPPQAAQQPVVISQHEQQQHIARSSLAGGRIVELDGGSSGGRCRRRRRRGRSAQHGPRRGRLGQALLLSVSAVAKAAGHAPDRPGTPSALGATP